MDSYLKGIEDSYKKTLGGSPDDIYDGIERAQAVVKKLQAMPEDEKLAVLHAVHVLYRIRKMMLEDWNRDEFAKLEELFAVSLNTLLGRMALVDEE